MIDFKKKNLILFVCICIVCMERPEGKLKHLVLGLRLKLSRLGSRCLCPLSHLTSPHVIILTQWAL